MEKQEKKIILDMVESPFFENVAAKNMFKLTMNSLFTAKNNKLSENFRKSGNFLFNNQLHESTNHEKIWHLYSSSVASAETSSEALALAYANRAAILLHMSKYEASSMDIDRALHNTKNICLRIKLLVRKAKCLHALGSNNSKTVLTEAESLLKEVFVESLKQMFINDITETKFMLKKRFEMLEEDYASIRKHSTLKTLNRYQKVDDFSSIEMQYDEQNGRHLIAARDIKPGEIVYVEKPYSHCVNSENIHLYCYHCLSTTWVNIPCNHCTWAMFCSEACKEEAWEQYHSIECSLYSHTKMSVDDNCVQLAVKILCQTLKAYGGVENLKAEVAKFDNRKVAGDIEGFIQNDKIHTNGFMTMYILSSNVPKFKMQKCRESAASFLFTLLKSSKLLREIYEENNVGDLIKNDNAIFLSALFLRLTAAIEINKLEMWNGSYNCPDGSILKLECCENTCCSKGIYIALVTSLINHSCNPNVNVCYGSNHKAIVYALQPIKKGEQIFRCYQDEFFLVNKSTRKRLLNKIYHFQCKCVACQNNWPTLLLSSSSPKEIVQSQYDRTIDLAFDGSPNYNERIIASLGRNIEKALENSSQPTLACADSIRTLSIIFNQLYGITLFVPSECNSEIRFV